LARDRAGSGSASLLLLIHPKETCNAFSQVFVDAMVPLLSIGEAGKLLRSSDVFLSKKRWEKPGETVVEPRRHPSRKLELHRHRYAEWIRAIFI
jgi:hypothetical protein